MNPTKTLFDMLAAFAAIKQSTDETERERLFCDAQVLSQNLAGWLNAASNPLAAPVVFRHGESSFMLGSARLRGADE